jgi:hypothetical protein
MARRVKLSTTIAKETMGFLQAKVNAGEAQSVADALDRAVARVRRLENRRRLAAATAAYYNDLNHDELGAERALERDVAMAASEVDVDGE